MDTLYSRQLDEWEDIGRAADFQVISKEEDPQEILFSNDTSLVFYVEPVSYQEIEGNVYYSFMLNAPNYIKFEIMDRYSSIREFYLSLQKELKNHRSLTHFPQFPQKTFITSKSEKFLSQRLKELSEFLNQILLINYVARCKITFEYLSENCVDWESQK